MSIARAWTNLHDLFERLLVRSHVLGEQLEEIPIREADRGHFDWNILGARYDICGNPQYR